MPQAFVVSVCEEGKEPVHAERLRVWEDAWTRAAELRATFPEKVVMVEQVKDDAAPY